MPGGDAEPRRSLFGLQAKPPVGRVLEVIPDMQQYVSQEFGRSAEAFGIRVAHQVLKRVREIRTGARAHLVPWRTVCRLKFAHSASPGRDLHSNEAPGARACPVGFCQVLEAVGAPRHAATIASRTRASRAATSTASHVRPWPAAKSSGASRLEPASTASRPAPH
jgi:hypothetical protein